MQYLLLKNLLNTSLNWARRLEIIIPYHFCDTRPVQLIRRATKFKYFGQLLRLHQKTENDKVHIYQQVWELKEYTYNGK